MLVGQFAARGDFLNCLFYQKRITHVFCKKKILAIERTTQGNRRNQW